MEVIPWLKVYVVTLILVFTIMIVIVRQKKLQFVIVNVTKRKIFKKQLVKLLNVNRKFNMTSQKVRSNFCDVFCYKYELYKKTFICFIFCIHIKT